MKKLISLILCLVLCLALVPVTTFAANTITGVDHLTFSSNAAFSIQAPKAWDGTLQYSTDGSAWTVWDGSSINAAQSGGTYYLCLRGTGNTVITGKSANRFILTASEGVACDGNIMTLLNYSNPNGATMGISCFTGLFDSWQKLTVAPTLPAMTLSKGCYESMFYNCSGLTVAPTLPAMVMADACYAQMFYGCNNLKTAPALPATTLDRYCYSRMFYACQGLTSAPQLPATVMKDHCYSEMFSVCWGLKTAPALPATTLYQYCYSQMFFYCKNLTAGPTLLPATTLKNGCYEAMFEDCTSLTAAPQLPATNLDIYCYSRMFEGCTSLQTAPQLPATTVPVMAYNRMFAECSSLAAAPQLPATTLEMACYQQMFIHCTGLTAAPQLNAVQLANSCYREMFTGCSNLKLYKYGEGNTWSVPASATAANKWNEGMFRNTGGTIDAEPVIGTNYYTTPADFYNIYVAGIPVTSANCDDVLNDGGSVKLVPNGEVYGSSLSGETLVLDNACLTDGRYYTAPDGQEAVIYIDRTVNVYLIGENVIGNPYKDSLAGIHIQPENYLLFFGSGSLTVSVSDNFGRAISASDSTVSTWDYVTLNLSGHYGYYDDYAGSDIGCLSLYDYSSVSAYGFRADDDAEGKAILCPEIEVCGHAHLYAEYNWNQPAVSTWSTDFRYTDPITVRGIKNIPGTVNKNWTTLSGLNESGTGKPRESEYRALEIQGNALVGDVNKDGFVNARDITLLKKMLLKNTNEARYDVTADGTADVRDLIKLKKILAS